VEKETDEKMGDTFRAVVNMRPLLVGEANPYGSDPAFALYPSPPGCSGERLCRLVMGLDPDDYLEQFDRMNLCAGKWRTIDARVAATSLVLQANREGRTLVLLGTKVAKAFGCFGVKPFTFFRAPAGALLVRLPHPSGLCREWGKPGAYDRARSVLRGAGVLL
jgi:hypothetical protein